MDRSQWQILQEMLAKRQAYNQGGAGVPGMPGAQSGAASPWDQVPGGGSTENAMAAYNPMVEDRAYYNKLADDGFASSVAGYGTALGAMAMPPNPLSLALALGGMGLGFTGGLAQGHGTRNAKRLGYQGN